VFWIHSSTAERFQQALVEIGTECRVPNFNNPNTNRLSVLRDWLLRDASHPWLMILDNADDPDIFQDGGEEIPQANTPLACPNTFQIANMEPFW
jgi:hypothetical protein